MYVCLCGLVCDGVNHVGIVCLSFFCFYSCYFFSTYSRCFFLFTRAVSLVSCCPVVPGCPLMDVFKDTQFFLSSLLSRMTNTRGFLMLNYVMKLTLQFY